MKELQEAVRDQMGGRDGRSKGKGDAKKGAMANGESAPDDALFFGDDRKENVVRQLYRKLDPTLEWAENNYYKLRIMEQQAGLIGVGPFWVDYARHPANRPFLSRHLADAFRAGEGAKPGVVVCRDPG